MSVSAAAELFHLLESNKLGEVEEIKKVFHDHFLCTKDNWLVNGLFDYYLSTNSLRTAEVLAGVRDPHDKHLLDRLSDILSKSGNSGQRIQALTMLGHIARRQPTWLYKLANHALFRDLLKLLKVEADILPLMSALLLLVMLLPMLPAALGPYLPEIFEVFGRLASYYYYQSSLLSPSTPFTSTTTVPNVIDKDHLYLIHLQVGLYSLFHRLYAMYPCNFISYLKQQYIQRDQLVTFTHTIRPMLDSVRMHPLLVTASKDAEISATRWKKMEHHDIVIECGRFTLDKCREEILSVVNARCTPPLDQSSITCAPINICGGVTTVEISNGEDDKFWSPSMAVPPHSPSFQNTSHEPRSAPPTPNNNRSGTSPPEAAIEATPETTPVKDLRKLTTRQAPLTSGAVRALNALSNSASSRPSTPTSINSSSAMRSMDIAGSTHGFLSNRLNKIMSDRQSVLQLPQKLVSNSEESGRLLEMAISQNGKNDSEQEDQEILEIVSSHGNGTIEMPKYVELKSEARNEKNTVSALTDSISQKIYKLRLYSQRHFSSEDSDSNVAHKIRHSKSCPDMEMQKKCSEDVTDQPKLIGTTKREDVSIQTCELFPYEYLFLGLLDQNSQNFSQEGSDSRLSPISMLDRYIETCTRVNSFSSKTKTNGTRQRQKKKGDEDVEEDGGDDDGIDPSCANQLLQLMQMQLQFERQRREVHAERNRRLLGKSRDLRASEENNLALTDRLKMVEREVETLKAQLEHNKKEAHQAEEQYKETVHHWQTKCVEEQRQSHAFKERLECLELELKSEQKKAAEIQQQLRSTEAELFTAGHQLKAALKAADRGKELERTLDIMQKKFVLLGEVQLRLEENTSTLSPTVIKQEAAQIQKSYTEELNNIRRQLESRTSHLEALKARLSELENKEARKETQLLDVQRLLQETKEQHAFELEAVESKYRAQVEINLLLEGRILELHGKLETATCSNASPMANPASSASPKERSPPLSTSLASSSEGSLAFIHPGGGIIMNDCCETATGEISNLQAMIEPSSSARATSPSRSLTQRLSMPKQD